MPFLSKQPCMLPRVLNASQCPPHNVFHEICEYPSYYDPLYYPCFYVSLFESEEKVCDWLLSGLEYHFLKCISCCSLSYQFVMSDNKVGYNSFFFDIVFHGVYLQIPLSYVESTSFSFCRLHRCIHTSFTTLRSLCRRVGHCMTHDNAVVFRMPIWLTRDDNVYFKSLSALSVSELRCATCSLSIPFLKTKVDFIKAILNDFFHQRLLYWDIVSLSNESWSTTVARYFCERYSDRVACALRDFRSVDDFKSDVSDIDSLDVYNASGQGDVWLTKDYKDMLSNLTRLSKEDILKSLHSIPCHFRPIYSTRSVRACRNVLLSHIRSRIRYLGSLSIVNFLNVFVSVLPFHTRCEYSRNFLTELILIDEYGSHIISNVRTSKNEWRKQQRWQDKQLFISNTNDNMQQISSTWPMVVSDDIVFECLENYRVQTVWVPPLICCVCGLERKKIEDVLLSNNNEPQFDFSLLHVKDCFISDLSPFQYGLTSVNNAVLDKGGIKFLDNSRIVMQICDECHSALKQKRIPRLSLVNYFYRGILPEEFHDLTWVEEMVCAKYRNTAHITRIYGSLDSSQPKVFHGNTCAHEMNVLSTASVLPRTIADINDMLTVVFLGAEKFDPKNLGQMFTIRKRKVWSFLIWLTTHNRLYFDIPLDSSIMDTYPDEDILPGIEDRIFQDHDTDVAEIFAEETAGFAEHPAQLMKDNSNLKLNNSSIFLEKTGVSDPDGFKISGRSSTAFALKNLISNRAPDLVLHRSSNAIVEYDNPDLMPGMFPTLFPLGIGGFEIPLRHPRVSFQAHANALLDVPNKSFRRHQSFIFVALNIMQRRLSHLHTHFTVRKSNFDSIASRLTALSPDILTRLADHLQQEHNLSILNSSEKDAFLLLNHVNTISARIPGSQAAKIYTRNEIRSYFGEFGLPQLYFTFNPSVTHNPIFQVMFGDRSVDLTAQFPFVVPSKERAIRIAEDPVAAADFFQFCVTSVFEHLFGWDYIHRRSSEKGGILGHISAFYGTCEFTERGSLHGHFLIWLLGGLNPNEIHCRLKEDAEFKTRFFAFFEDIIEHHLPDVDVVIDPQYEPRIERPPLPPKSSTTISTDIVLEWQLFMKTEVKKLGEILQRHKCMPVCHKYGNVDKCRFLFPHDIEIKSYFEEETNSIILKCLDSMVNYFNRYILVYCRHNHDIKCILSGKAAKAAMCYITDYITKMDMKTYQMLSLLSRAVASVPQEPEISVRQQARILLHKCLTQFTRQQQIHAQQAARYLRGNNDSISSHETTPMMSALLLDFVQAEYKINVLNNYESNNEEDDTNGIEHAFLKIQIDQCGNLVKHNQLTDYWYRGHTLSHMNFYDFARCITLQIKRKNKLNISNDDRLGVQIKHSLLNEHPLAATHHLVQHTDDNPSNHTKQYIPRIIGTHIPRENSGQQWKIFTLAHFKPFDKVHPLIQKESSINETFQLYIFSSRSQSIMKNWEDIHECEDERDEERLRKRAALTIESLAMTNSINESSMNIDSDSLNIISSPIPKYSRKDFIVLQVIHVLEQSQWLTSSHFHTSPSDIISSKSSSFPTPSSSQLKIWMKSIKSQEKQIAEARQNGPKSAHSSYFDITDIKNTENNCNMNAFSFSSYCLPTYSENLKNVNTFLTVENIITKIGEEYNLEQQQWIAFRIITRCFIDKYLFKKQTPLEKQPLRMLLTGPGGTGKTHVVKAVQNVMNYYGAGHMIRFLAPTGSAASLINGMTIHKGLGIKVQANNKGKSNRKLGENCEDYNVIISVQNKTKLRNEWRLVEIVMIDECSLLSAELLSQVDAALRFAKEIPDEWFGGITVIFAGDFYQYPPVCATPLYNSISNYNKTSNSQLEKRLGRLAWKSINAVVNFSEQKRMKDDIDYATAVTHLRTRECTITDVDLFNTRIIKSATHENGIDMSINDNFNATAIVPTNLLRQTMNVRKADTNCFKYNLTLTNCAAIDICSTMNLSQQQHEYLLHLDMSSSQIKDSLPGFLPLYIGMPIILKCKNISTDLGITNGSQGYIREIFTDINSMNFTYCTCALVEFQDSKVSLPLLPRGYFPVIPVTTSFIVQLPIENGMKTKLKITRSQLPIQPAFAVTGHSAQGKTLPKVLTNLHEGGFGAYVAASRAQTRHDLYITEPVVLEDLNKPIPYNLLQETKRLHALEHNTYIRFGFQKSNYEDIPDPESEQNFQHLKFVANFRTSNPKNKNIKSDSINNELSTKDLKRKFNESPNVISTPTNFKRQRISHSSTKISQNRNTFEGKKKSETAGCTWSSTNWSCAYDCVFMSIFYAYLSFNDTTKEIWCQQTVLTNILTHLFQNLMTSPLNMNSSSAFNIARDHLRDFLSDSDTIHFPRFGTVGAPAERILYHLTNPSKSMISVHRYCSSFPPCSSPIITTINQCLPSTFFTSLWTTSLEQIGEHCHPENVNTQDWINLLLNSKQNTSIHPLLHTNTCLTQSTISFFFLNDPPPLLTFEIIPDTVPNHIPCKKINIKTKENVTIDYSLRAIIYYGDFHFTARLFDSEDNIWIYDSQKNKGFPSLECSWSNNSVSHKITNLEERHAHLYIYGL